LRKILIAVLAALTALAAVAIAQAQTPGPGAEITVTVSPSKVGTKKKPKPAKVKLSVVNSDSSQTADGLKIYHPKQLTISGKGLKKCSRAKLEAELSPSVCPRASRLGTGGTADAIAGVNGGSPTSLKFNVTPFLIANKKIAFLIEQQGGNINALAIGTFKKASGLYGSVLEVSIPKIARQVGEPPNASYNGLKSLETTLYKKVGKKSLYKTTGCPSNRSLPFKTVIEFQANPNPPKAETVEATAGANCRK
jgi:hypothetical protein